MFVCERHFPVRSQYMYAMWFLLHLLLLVERDLSIRVTTADKLIWDRRSSNIRCYAYGHIWDSKLKVKSVLGVLLF